MFSCDDEDLALVEESEVGRRLEGRRKGFLLAYLRQSQRKEKVKILIIIGTKLGMFFRIPARKGKYRRVIDIDSCNEQTGLLVKYIDKLLHQ